MGVNLTPITVKRTLELDELGGKTLAVDALGELYQFLALIRLPDGTPLQDGQGHITSHLAGLFYRSTRLWGEHGIKLAFVFDGQPPPLKSGELERRRAVKDRFTREYQEALAAGNLSVAYSKSTMTSRITGAMLTDAKRLLDLLGLPWIEAPAEGEAQAAAMAAHGEVWAAASKDYDALLFGAPRLVRFLTISGREFLPSKGVSRVVKPEMIDTREMLAALGLKHEQIIDLAILMGTDFNAGIRGIGPKKALKLIREHGSIEGLPAEVRGKVAPHFRAVRDIYLNPNVTLGLPLAWKEPDEAGIVDFLCRDRAFSEDRIRRALERLREGRSSAAGGGMKTEAP